MTNETENDLILQRREKLEAMRGQGNAYPNSFKRDATAGDLHQRFDGHPRESLEAEPVKVKVGGRIMSRRVMGKAAFVHIQDMTGQIQLHVRRDELPEGRYAEFKQWDIGDIIGAEGELFKTNTDELTIKVSAIHLLTKSLRPLPEKFHGLADLETRHRQRYLDLIANESARDIFITRTRVIDFLRSYLNREGFIEVETPMMHVIPGGATAKPFTTYHNSLDMELFLRIAPELFLKRLLVGGLDQVFEINRCFRNEGLSPRHNPEFTMLEFYKAYADYEDLINLTEDMIRQLAHAITGSHEVDYQGARFDMSLPFTRMTLLESILEFNQGVTPEDLCSVGSASSLAERLGVPVDESFGLGKIQVEIFEKTVEPNLQAPCFITAYPTEVSPLARMNENDPFLADRFEFFVGGREIANGFSELNDPDDQAERFKKQVKDKEAGNEEAMHYDSDYITALEYGMPPAAGEGVGIDRLVMLLTDTTSIRDVILFPHMRPKD